MTGTLKVSTARLRSTASNFQSTGQHIQRMTQSMTNIVNQLSGCVWINEHVTDLNAMAGEYERAENANKNMINSLKEDVIS